MNEYDDYKYLHVIPSTEGMTEFQLLLIAVPSILLLFLILYVAFRVWKSLREDKKEAIRSRMRVRDILKKKPK